MCSGPLVPRIRARQSVACGMDFIDMPFRPYHGKSGSRPKAVSITAIIADECLILCYRWGRCPCWVPSHGEVVARHFRHLHSVAR